ncbi:MAG: AI-2E family transporter [Thermodesulfobacteriota bacterium]|nr:MAG: AI-2E family transporter [Thermodesulfobacteriota bacterium]
MSGKLKIHPLLAVACIVIIVAGMQAIAPVLNLFLVALLLAVSIMPLVAWQLNRGWPRTLALGLTILFVIVIGASLTSILGLAINNMAQKAPFYKDRIAEIYQSGLNYISSKGINIEDVQSLELFSPDKLVSVGSTFIEGILSTFGNFFFVLLLMIFILIEFSQIQLKAARKEYEEDSWQLRFSEITNDLKRYISITALSGLMAAVSNTILLLVVGVDFAIMWGFLSFLFSFIPNLGFILSVIPPALIALLEYGWPQCLIVVVGFIVINSLVDNILKPKFLGQEFNISILMVFVSLLFWGWVLGPIGAILGVPMTMAVKKIIVFMNKDIDREDNFPILQNQTQSDD